MTKTLTVRKEFRTRTYSRPETTVPKIEFAGEYLKTFGFRIGDKLELSVNENEIIIRKS